MGFLNKYRWNLRKKIAFFSILIVIISLGVLGIAFLIAEYHELVEETGEKLISLASYGARHIQGDDLLNITHPESGETLQYGKVQRELEILLEAANKMPLYEVSDILTRGDRHEVKHLHAVYIYTLHKEEEKVFFGADAYYGTDKKNAEMPGTMIQNASQIQHIAQIYGGLPYLSSDPYIDDYGYWITAYVPIFDSQNRVAGVLCIDAPLDFINNRVWKLAVHTFLVGAILIILVSFVSIYLSKRITNPLTVLSKGAEIIGEGDLDYKIHLEKGDEIGDLAAAFNSMAERLNIYMEDLQVTTREKEKIQSELTIARNIQLSMLPSNFPPFPERDDFSIYAMMEPAQEVGGDFYDFFFIDEERLCFLVGDVSGKGVPAALFMVITKTLLKNQALTGAGAAEILYHVNNLLCSENEELMFVTAFLCILDTTTGELEYSNAGHNPPLLSKAAGEFAYLKIDPNFILAGMKKFPYHSQIIKLEKGDTLFLYTDGVTEAMNWEEEQYSEKRLQEDLKGLEVAAEDDIIHTIKGKISIFVGEASPSDDITMLVVKYSGPK